MPDTHTRSAYFGTVPNSPGPCVRRPGDRHESDAPHPLLKRQDAPDAPVIGLYPCMWCGVVFALPVPKPEGT